MSESTCTTAVSSEACHTVSWLLMSIWHGTYAHAYDLCYGVLSISGNHITPYVHGHRLLYLPPSFHARFALSSRYRHFKQVILVAEQHHLPESSMRQAMWYSSLAIFTPTFHVLLTCVYCGDSRKG